MLHDQVRETGLLVKINIEHSLPVLRTTHNVVCMEYIDQALKVFLEARASEAKRALQILAAYSVISLNNGFDRGDVATGCLFAQLSQRVD